MLVFCVRARLTEFQCGLEYGPVSLLLGPMLGSEVDITQVLRPGWSFSDLVVEKGDLL